MSSSTTAAQPSALRQILTHAGSVLLGQLAWIGFGVADTMLVARYNSEDLAALSLGIALSVSVMVAMFGVMSALMPAVGRLYGAKQYEEIGQETQQGIYLALLCAAVGAILLLTGEWAIQLARVPAHLHDKVAGYLGFIALSLPFSLLFRVYVGLNVGTSRPLFVTALQVGILPLKIALSAWFIFGGAGLAPQGSVGAAMATCTTMICTALLGFATLALHPAYKPYGIFKRWYKPDRSRLLALAKIGVPSGLAYFIEVTSFTLMAIFIGRLGTTLLAGHQIAANAASVLYMVPLSLAMSTSALVAQELGARRPLQAKRAAYIGLRWSLGICVVLGVIVFAFRTKIASLYSPDPAVAAVAASLFIFIVAYQFGDTLQCVASFVLRSYRIATLPTVIYAITLWGLGLGGGYLLGFNVSGNVPQWLQGAYGFWFSNALALLIVSAAFVWLLRLRSRAEIDTMSTEDEAPESLAATAIISQ